MDPVLFLSFMVATLLIVVTPGPSCALASSQAVKHGRRALMLTIAGDALGTILHILIAVVSLNALISVADMVLPWLQMAGGMFILWLAAKSLFGTDAAPEKAILTPGRSAFLSGFFACVTNPKAIVFFVALFPGFISPDLNAGMQSLVYGAVFVTLDAISIYSYSMLALYVMNSPLTSRLDIDKISGMGLCGVGALLIWKGWKELPSQ